MEDKTMSSLLEEKSALQEQLIVELRKLVEIQRAHIDNLGALASTYREMYMESRDKDLHQWLDHV